ncbi:hypothetical protein AB0B31_33180 [Catellatospora citrea]
MNDLRISRRRCATQPGGQCNDTDVQFAQQSVAHEARESDAEEFSNLTLT